MMTFGLVSLRHPLKSSPEIYPNRPWLVALVDPSLEEKVL